MEIIATLFPHGLPPWKVGTMIGDVLEAKGFPAHLWVEDENEFGDDQQWKLTWIDQVDTFEISETFYGAGETLEKITYWFEQSDEAVNKALYSATNAHFQSFFEAEDRRTLEDHDWDCTWFNKFQIRVSRSLEATGGVIDFDRAANGAKSVDPTLIRHGHKLVGRVIIQFGQGV